MKTFIALFILTLSTNAFGNERHDILIEGARSITCRLLDTAFRTNNREMGENLRLVFDEDWKNENGEYASQEQTEGFIRYCSNHPASTIHDAVISRH